MNYNWNWGIFFELEPGASGRYLDYLIGGLGWTVVTAVFAWMLALLLGLVVGTLRTTGHKAIERICFAYTELFRNIPLLVQMFLWYFVLPELLPEQMGNAMKAMAPPWGPMVAPSPSWHCPSAQGAIREEQNTKETSEPAEEYF